MNRVIGAIFIGGLVFGLGGCTEHGERSCAPGQGVPMAVFTLFFGENIPGRANLTEQEWQLFLDNTVSANLPLGYTVLDAHGAWMNPATHRTIQEPSKVVVAALPDAPASLASIDRVRTGYQLQFQQQLVGMTVEHACAAF
jgi:hypothetical protein